MIATPKLAVGVAGRSNFRSTSPRPMMKAVPLPTIPVTANQTASKSYYSSSENLTRSQSVDDEPIYDVPPCMANNWDSSQTLPRPSALTILPQLPNLNSVSSACSSLSTINSVNSYTSVATLTAEGGDLQMSPQSPSNNLLELSFNIEHYQRSPGSRQSEPPRHSPSSPHETRPPNSNSDRKRSKSKSRSLLHRSGSVLKSMFGGSSEDNHCTKPAKKVNEGLSIEVNDYPTQMQGRLLLKELSGLSFDEVTSEILAANEMVPWQSVTIFTSHNQLCMQKNQSGTRMKEDVTFDLYAAKCSPVALNSVNQKRRSGSANDHKSAVFKLCLSSNDKLVHVFQTDTRDAMCQWVNCIQNISQSTPVYSSQGSGSMSHSPVHDGNLPALNRYQMSTSISYVPLIVTECCQRIEQLGLYTMGIYRVPGNTAHINSLLSQINPKQTTFDFSSADVHTIASLLKTFLRRLPEPLITHDWYSSLIVANRKRDRQERLQQMKMVIHQLPIHNFATLKYLMNHLDKIARKSERNKMDFSNLATVFGPTLLRSPQSSSSKNSSQRDDMITVWGDMLEQRSILEQIIANHQWLFASSVSSVDNVSQSSDNSLPDVVKDCGSLSSRDSGYPRRGSNVSLGSLTSIAQMHLSCTASAVRKISVEKIANFGSNSVRLPKSNSPAKYSPNFAAKANKSVSPSPTPRRSKSMSDKIEKNKKRADNLEVESNSSHTSRGIPAMERFNSFSTASGVRMSDCAFDENGRPINGELGSSNNKLLEDLDSLIESLKAEWKEKDEKVRRSAEEGQVMFDNFCRLFSEEEKKTSPKRKSKASTTLVSVEGNVAKEEVKESKDSTPSDITGELEDIIAKELDAKIANLRLEYTFKVDSLPVVSLENGESEEKKTGEKVFAKAEISESSVPQKAETEFITNPSFSVKRQCGSGILTEIETAVDLRERPKKEAGSKLPARQVSLYDNVDQSTTKDILDDLSKFKVSESKKVDPFPIEPNTNSNTSGDPAPPAPTSSVKAAAARINQKTQVGKSQLSDIRAKRSSDQTPLMKVDTGSASICIQNPYVGSESVINKLNSPSSRSNIGFSESVQTHSPNVGKHTRRGSNAGPISPTTANWQISNCVGPQMSFSAKINQNNNELISNTDQTASTLVTGTEKASSGSSAAIDKTASRSWVTRSNPDLLGVAGRSGRNNNSAGKNSSSGHSTPAKQLIVFQSSQV